jgi:hypothetical protein
VQGLDLAIQIGFGYMIHVDQGNCPDAGSYKRLCGPGADPTQAHYAHMCLTQTSKLGCRKQPSSAGKLA